MLSPGALLVVQALKYPPAIQETWVWSLVKEDPLEGGMATHSSILAWEIPRTEESGRLQSIGSHRTRHNWATNTFTCSYSHHRNPNSLQLCWILLEALKGARAPLGREKHMWLVSCVRECVLERDSASWFLFPQSVSALNRLSWIAATAAKSLQSCPTLCDPRNGSPPSSPVPGILQARTLEWVVISFFGLLMIN